MEITPINREKIFSQKTFRGRIVTNSMDPLLKTGDEILVEVKSKELKRFDIIVFEMEGLLTCHFVWNLNQFIEPKLIQTRSLKGQRDFPITYESYIGKVISHRLSFWQKMRILLFN